MSNQKYQFGGAFSFGKAQRAETFHTNQDSPSPNVYSIREHSSSAHKFSTAQRFSKINEGPSVGDYDVSFKEDKRKLKPTFKKKHIYKPLDDYPYLGPGTYKLRDTSLGRKAGFGDRFLQTYETEVPPPNLYNNQPPPNRISFNKKANTTFTKTLQDSIYQRYRTPDPYENSNPEPRPKGQSFTRSTRDAYYYRYPTPGPDYYQLQSLQNSRGFTIAGKIPQPQPETETPGPGAYDPTKKLTKTQYQWSSIKKGDLFHRRDQSPGPGAYDVPKWKEKGVGFAKSNKFYTEASKSPGPGFYKTNYTSLLRVGGLIGKRPKRIRDQESPGPGSYETQTLKAEGRSFTTSKRFPQSHKHLPGPGQYEFSDGYQSQYCTFSRAKSKREQIEKSECNQLGVGDYTISGDLGYMPSYLQIKKKEKKKQEQSLKVELETQQS